MAVIVTRMPSTGEVTNVSHSPDTLSVVEARWADTDCVTVYSDEEYASFPHCETCGNWTGLRRCADCQ